MSRWGFRLFDSLVGTARHLAPQLSQVGDHEIEPLTLNQLHGVEAEIVFLSDFEDRHDIGVMHAGSGFGFSLEPPQRILVASYLPRQHFEGHPSSQ